MTENGFRAVTIRNDTARDIISGFAAATLAMAGAWRLVDSALADAPAALAALGRVRAELQAVRLDQANLLAAIRATLAACADGEDDALWYLRDELNARQMSPSGTGGHHDRLPADAPAGKTSAARGHAADDGHQLR